MILILYAKLGKTHSEKEKYVCYILSPLSLMVIVAVVSGERVTLSFSASTSTTYTLSSSSTVLSSVMTTSTHALEVPGPNVSTESEIEKSSWSETPSNGVQEKERGRKKERKKERRERRRKGGEKEGGNRALFRLMQDENAQVD